MNHIHRLQADNAEMTEALQTTRDTVDELFAYLTSAKFHTDPTVQVSDVMHRLAPLRCLPVPR